MRKLGNRWILAALATTLVSGVAFAQQAGNSDPYTGVSQPPPDATITSAPDAQPAPPPAKPSPAVPAEAPATPPPPPAATAAAPPVSSSVAPAAANPDFDIVSSVPGQNQAPATSGVALQTRPGADDGIVSSIPSSPNDLPEGTNIRVKLTDRLSTRETSAGSPFQGEVVRDVYKGGSVIIPAGSTLKGRVISASQGRHLGPSATLSTDSEGGIQPRPELVKNAVVYGAAAGTGAVVGAFAAGPVGALVGSAVGAGIVTAHIFMQHPSAAVVPAGSIVTFSLTEPMGLTPTKN
jgi:hypothetical protein